MTLFKLEGDSYVSSSSGRPRDRLKSLENERFEVSWGGGDTKRQAGEIQGRKVVVEKDNSACQK